VSFGASEGRRGGEKDERRTSSHLTSPQSGWILLGGRNVERKSDLLLFGEVDLVHFSRRKLVVVVGDLSRTGELATLLPPKTSHAFLSFSLSFLHLKPPSTPPADLRSPPKSSPLSCPIFELRLTTSELVPPLCLLPSFRSALFPSLPSKKVKTELTHNFPSFLPLLSARSLARS